MRLDWEGTRPTRSRITSSSPASTGPPSATSSRLSSLSSGKQRSRDPCTTSLTLLPHSSLTDTSYFPTEDLNDVPEQPTGSESSSGSKDLAFLGYTVRSCLLNSQRPPLIPPSHSSAATRATPTRTASKRSLHPIAHLAVVSRFRLIPHLHSFFCPASLMLRPARSRAQL